MVFASDKNGEHDFSNLELKLIDFGFANINTNNNLNDFVGTPYYLAPEIVLNKPYGSGCDIWSLGVLTYYIIDGSYPFLGTSRQELFDNITADKPLPYKGRNW